MTGSANVSLSAFEKQLVTDASWILTKNNIIQKLFVLFGELSETWQSNTVLQQLPSAINVMLDYPRCFSKEDVFAIRTFFWWGNFFSITLHLKGKYKEQFEQVIAAAISNGELSNAWINYTDEEWIHHFEHTNMNPVQLTDAAALRNKKVLKLAYKLDLNDWDSAEDFLKKVFDQYMQILAD